MTLVTSAHPISKLGACQFDKAKPQPSVAISTSPYHDWPYNDWPYNERMITMIARLLTPLLIAGAAAAGIALAPVAAAGPPDCTATSMTSICQRPGHNSIYTSPNTPDQNSSIGWPMGIGPVPPIMAMN